MPYLPLRYRGLRTALRPAPSASAAILAHPVCPVVVGPLLFGNFAILWCEDCAASPPPGSPVYAGGWLLATASRLRRAAVARRPTTRRGGPPVRNGFAMFPRLPLRAAFP